MSSAPIKDFVLNQAQTEIQRGHRAKAEQLLAMADHEPVEIAARMTVPARAYWVLLTLAVILAGAALLALIGASGV